MTEYIKGVYADEDLTEESGTVQCASDYKQDLFFSLHDPIADFLPPLSDVSNLHWEALVTRSGMNTLYMTFPYCHGVFMQKIGQREVHAYDIWMLNSVTQIYEPIAVWIKKECNASGWMLDSLDFWFEKGEGMIGKVGARQRWEPNKQQHLGEDRTFLRHSNALKAGLKRGDAIWFPFNSHRFVIGFYTQEQWIDENIRACILDSNEGAVPPNNTTVEEGSPMEVEDTRSAAQRICLDEM